MTSCPGCGSPVPTHVQFCTTCGVRVASPEGVASSPPAAPQLSTQPSPTPMAATVPPFEPGAGRRSETRRLVLIGVSALLLTLIVRIALAAANAEPDGELVASLPVGPEGGTATFDDGGKLTVPQGAVAQNETITVRRRLQREPIRGVNPGGGPPVVIPGGTVFVYFLGPADIQLLRPVTLTLPALSGPGAGLIFVSTSDGVTFLEGTQRGRSVSIQLTSFDFGRSGAFVNRR